ncbi:NAD-dependent epimerase/dehydratase family protein [Paenibacillus sp. JX-17]|uniref:NAD-dependent epimerase/dehydratase family protein n=1 Tax=Paenibacillus lacisoli TaxID=3064525 RepID=A0ABT9CCJ2_9BACL|nr:NAD-dependent epimerase/dehydratase family protein [Paenibacillus sp. JX-17]MDO7906981.1 NAD-dependent epimerase/dehydratase family protein [Paenibacillus sp. JX-17]
MKMLITGGAGFIGSHLAETLLEQNVEVHIVDNLSSGSISNVPENVTFIEEDVRSASLQHLMAAERYDTVFHLAAQCDVQHSISNPAHDASVNILGTLNVLEGCVRNKMTKMIFSSTSGVYGNPEYLPVDEQHRVQPLSFYGLSKLAAESYITLYHALYGVPYTILRYANVYGPRQNTKGEGGVVAQFMNRLFTGSPLTIYGDGEQTRDFIYVKDVAAANIAAVHNGNQGVFNISTGHGRSVNTLAALLGAMHSSPLLLDYAPAKSGDIRDSCLLHAHAAKELQWTPRFSIDDGLRQLYDYYAASSPGCP